MGYQLARLLEFRTALPFESGQIPQLPENDQDRNAGEKPRHDCVRNELGQESETQDAHSQLKDTAGQRQRKERLRAIVSASTTQTIGGYQGHSAGRIEDHD